MAARNRVEVHVEQHFARWGESAMREIAVRLDVIMPAAAAAAQKVEVPEQSGDLKRSIHALPARRTGKGLEAGIGASDYKANWYEQGAGAGRSKSLKHSRTRARAAAREASRKQLRASGSGGGVKALHYLRKGLYSTRTLVFHEIGEGMRRARSGLL